MSLPVRRSSFEVLEEMPLAVLRHVHPPAPLKVGFPVRPAAIVRTPELPVPSIPGQFVALYKPSVVHGPCQVDCPYCHEPLAVEEGEMARLVDIQARDPQATSWLAQVAMIPPGYVVLYCAGCAQRFTAPMKRP